MSPRKALLGVIVTASFAALVAGPADGMAPPTPPNPHVSAPLPSGPKDDGTRNHPFGAAVQDLGGRGYVEREMFFSGTTAAGDYTSRMLVRMPRRAADFSGTVVSEWTNVSNGYDVDCLWEQSADQLLRRGDAYVAVDAQTVGVDDPTTGLKAWNPERYAPVHIPPSGYFVAEEAGYEIFTQALQAIRRPVERRPLGDLRVEQQIATGCSQSAGTMQIFANTFGDVDGLVDGYFITKLSTTSAESQENPSSAFPTLMPQAIGVPVMQVNTESDPSAVPLPDTDEFRLWEVPGTTHVDHDSIGYLAQAYRRDFGRPLPPAGCDLPAYSHIPVGYVQNAALAHLERWAAGGNPPPTQPRMRYAADGSIERDRYGNALGGIRLPQFAVPTANDSRLNSGNDICQRLAGRHVPFSRQVIHHLYPTHAAYVRAFARATRRSVAAGVLLPRDAREGLNEARQASVPH